jgi:hypothetical protein
MIETFFDRSFAIDRLRQGPLAGQTLYAALTGVHRGCVKLLGMRRLFALAISLQCLQQPRS